MTRAAPTDGRLRPLGRLMTHVRLVQGMAQATQIDLVAAVEDGSLELTDWAEMVQTCRSCDGAEDCPGWLDDHVHADVEAPDTCLNKARFDRLRALRQEPETD